MLDDFETIMAREQRRIDALKASQAALQDQIHSTEAYMRWCVNQHILSQLPSKGDEDGRQHPTHARPGGQSQAAA